MKNTKYTYLMYTIKQACDQVVMLYYGKSIFVIFKLGTVSVGDTKTHNIFHNN